MKAVWKFPFAVNDRVAIPMPIGAEVLTVQVQRGSPMIWALVDIGQERTEHRYFALCGTGHERDDLGRYIGTFQLSSGALVFHLFEQDDPFA